MTDRPRHQTPPLSPVLLAGLALRPLPPWLLAPFLEVAMAAMHRRHPDVFRRLGGLGSARFLIDPIDLPFSFALRPGGRSPRLWPVGEESELAQPTATIRGPLSALVDLLEGRVDGDALFFSRQLVIEGDTEAVVTLRNAIDAGEIDLAEDLFSLLGPLARPARLALDAARALLARAARDLELVRAAVVAPVAWRCERQAAEIRGLEEQLAELRHQLRRASAAAGRPGKSLAGNR